MGGRRKYKKQSSPCNAMFSSAHSNTLCLHDSLQRLPSKHAIGREGRDLPELQHFVKVGLGAGRGRGQDWATESIEH